jgi:hypothetical protein
VDACLVTVGTLTEIAFHRVCFYYTMLDACVAEKALYLMVSNMILMEELLGVFCFEDLPLIMALETCVFLHVPVPGDHVRVTCLALNAPFHKLLVIEIKRIYLNVSPCLEMTGITSGKVVLLPFGLLEVADKAVLFRHSYMGSLDDLRMTGGASELHISLEFVKVLNVVEDNVFKYDLFIEVFPLVATALEAA